MLRIFLCSSVYNLVYVLRVQEKLFLFLSSMGSACIFPSICLSACVSSSITTKPYLNFALELVKESKEILCKSFQQAQIRKEVETKGDGSPVTELDRKVELLFRKSIKAKFPEHRIWGEEFGSSQDQSLGRQGGSDFLWLIDPIDGTRSFIKGSPFFGTLLALLYKGKAVLGVIDMPLLNECYWGEEGQASFKKDAKGVHKIITRSCSDLSKALLRTTAIEYFSQSEGEDKTAKAVFDSLEELCGKTRYGGDCYCYANLACGLADIVLEVGLAPYDFFALIPVIEGAGGRISDWQGSPLSLQAGKGDVLACGDAKTHKVILEHIKKIRA